MTPSQRLAAPIVVAVMAASCPRVSGEDAKLEVKVRQSVLAAFREGTDPKSAVASPDASRVAVAFRREGKWRVAVNEAEGKPFDEVGRVGISFSEDGTRFAYTGARGGKWFLVVDGVEGPEHPTVPRARPVFSPGGRRVVSTWVDEKARLAPIELSGPDGPPVVLSFPPVFSADGAHWASREKREGGKWRYVVDGEEGKEFDGVSDLAFSKDGRWAHLAKTGDRTSIVHDDGKTTVLEASNAKDLRLGPGGTIAALAIERGGKWQVVLGGKEGSPYDGVNGVTLGPDGRRVAFAAQRGTRSLAVVDGRESAEYDGVDPNGFRFSRDGGRIAYWAGRAGKGLYVVDGKESGAVDAGGMGGFSFSPDGKRTAWSGRRGGKWVVTVDGVDGAPFDGIAAKTPVFSPDAGHVAYLAGRGNAWVLLVDGTETPFPGVPLPCGIVFDGPNAFHTLAASKEGFVRVDAEIVSK